MSSPVASSSASRIRKYNAACENCRQKKRKCDNSRPSCRQCKIHGLSCVYRRNITPAYVMDLEIYASSVRRLLDRIQFANKSDRAYLMEHLHEDLKNLPPDPSVTKVPQREGAGHSRANARISKDSENRLTLHGPSSLYYLSKAAETVSKENEQSEAGDIALDIEQHLMLEWAESLTYQTSFPTFSNDVWQYLLRLHFTWVQPLFGMMRENAFLDDLQRPRTSKSCFSPFLLYSVCAHVSRHSDLTLLSDNLSDVNPFLTQARLLVMREMERGGSYSAISGLLFLSAREVAVGNVSQAWLYNSLSVSMIEDLGIHLDGKISEDDTSLTEDELATRRHLFWSTYLYDKMTCLYIGRTPKLAWTQSSPELVFDDNDAEDDLWSPLGNRLDKFPPFTPTQAYASATYMSNCRLSLITNDILLYDAGVLRLGDLETTRAKLVSWRQNLPPHLTLHSQSHRACFTPSHIINLNCLYHMNLILLDRRQVTGSLLSSTVSSAVEILSLAQISHRIFCDRQAVLSHCYCIYTAATVLLSRLRFRVMTTTLTNEELSIIKHLQWGLSRLHETSITMKAIAMPVKVLREHLNSLPSHILTALVHEPEIQVEMPENLAPPAPPEATFESLDSIFGDSSQMLQSTLGLDDQGTFDMWTWLGGGELGGTIGV